jgi:hypothetical protein
MIDPQIVQEQDLVKFINQTILMKRLKSLNKTHQSNFLGSEGEGVKGTNDMVR